MVAKLLITSCIIALLSLQVLGLSIHDRVKRDTEEPTSDGEAGSAPLSPNGIQLGSQQDAQSTQEHSTGKKGAATQQSQQGQQQLAAAFGGKHYLLQQQTAMGQQLAKLGRKSAVQQLVDTQKQAVANGVQEKSSHSQTNEDVGGDNIDSIGGEPESPQA